MSILLYLPSISGQFVWDDDTHLTSNILTQPNGLYRTWFTSQQPNYWPITWTGFWIQWKLFGLDPTGYHIINMVLHACNAVLAWRVLHRLRIPGAFAAAAIFAVHPLNTEAVAWITQFKTLLSFALFLSAILLWLEWNEKQSVGLYVSSLLLYVAALLSKPSIVMLPVVLLLLLLWKRREVSRKDALWLLPFFLAAGIMSLTEIWFQSHRSMAGMVVRSDGFLSRFAGAGWVVWFYLLKIIAPIKLSLVYPRWTVDAARAQTWVPLLATFGVLGVSWWKRAGWGRPVLLAFAYYVVTLFPVLGFFNIFYMRYSFVADHWQYQSMIGITALIAAAGTYLASRNQNWSMVVRSGFVLILVTCSVLAFQRQRAFRDAETLYRDTILKNEQAVLARSNLGSLLYRRKRSVEATAHLTKALATSPDDPEANATLANILFDRQEYQLALEHYQRALLGMPPPDRFKVHFEMAQTYLRLNNRTAAAEQLHKVLELRPDLKRAQDLLSSLTPSQP